jgi:hypothetical protein
VVPAVPFRQPETPSSNKYLARAGVCHHSDARLVLAVTPGLGNLAGMDENRARRITDALRDRGIAAHLRKSGIDAYSVQVPAGGGREAIWGAEGTTGLEAEVLLDGDLVGFVPQIPGSDRFDEAQIVDAIARADYDEPEGRERPEAPAPEKPLPHEGGVFRRFIDGFRYDSD